MLHRVVPFEVKEVDMEAGTFEGYAAVFGNVDDGGDVIEPGAFTKTLTERGHRVKICWQHDPKEPIGKPIEMREDAKGLYVKAKLSLTQRGRDALTLLRDGVINELSIGYDAVKPVYEGGVRHLKEIRLWEISPVTFAMNPLATVTGVKQADEPGDTKEGRVLSKRNRDLVRQAIEALQALLAAAEPSEDTPSDEEAAAKSNAEPDTHSVVELAEQLRELKKLFAKE